MSTKEQKALDPIGTVFCKGDINLGSGCMRCGRCAVQMAAERDELRAEFEAKMRPAVPEINYTELIEACYRLTRQAQGSRGCIQFKAGAEWFRNVWLNTALQPKAPPHQQMEPHEDQVNTLVARRFVADVLTAAGLVRRGKQSKVLADRLADGCANFLKALSGRQSVHPSAHPDDMAVDHFASEMKVKMANARAKGRSGWQTCPPAELSRLLHEHVEKGDPRDVANFCMMLWSIGWGIGTLRPKAAQKGGA